MPLRLLLIEDSEDDALLQVLELRKGGFDPDFARVETPQELEAALDGSSWDAVIADYNLPAFTGLDALRIIQERGLDLPFILVSGVIGEEKAVEAMKAGVHDYIMKGNFPRLAPALERELRDAEVRRERRLALEELHRSHGELEIIVRHRTAELERTNEVLRAEIIERKHMEDALRESKEQLRLFIEHAPAALAMFDTEMRYLSVSRRWLSDYGLGERALIGESHYDVFSEITAEWREAHHRGLTGEVLRAEADRFERADGSVQWIRWEIRPWHSADGEIGGIVIFTEDNTEIKRADEALRNNERLYRAIGESIDYGIWTCNPDGRCTYASDSFLSMVGMTQEQCSDFGWGDVLHPADAENTISAWKECVSSEGVWDIEHRFRGTDGQWHPVLARGVPVRNEHGELISWAGINLDISRMKQAEDELRASEEKFSTMLKTVPIAIALATLPDGALYDVNPAWLDLTGITRKEDAIGKTSLELGLISDAAQRQNILNEFRQNGFARNVEQTFCTRKGVQRTVLINLDRVEIGGCAFILSTMEEITERKRAEAALQQKQTELLEAQSIAKIGSWHWDAHTDATTGSDQLLRIYGFDPATQAMPDFLEQRWLCYPISDWERINAAVQYTLKTGVGYELDVQAFRDGAQIWVTTRGEAVLDAEGRVVGLRGTVQDITDRKLAEESLRVSEERYRSLVETAQFAIFINRNNRIEYANPETIKLFGVKSIDDLIGRSPYEFVHPDAHAAMTERIKILLHGGKVPLGETRILQGNGDERFVEVTAVSFADPQGLAIQVMMHDITERKRVEKELQKAKDNLELRVSERTEELLATMDSLSAEIAERQSAEKLLRLSEERYRKVVEDQTETINRCNADGTFTFVNDVFCRVFGKTSDELLGSKWYPVAFPDDVPIIEERLRTLSPSNPVVVIENRIYSVSGSIRWMQFVNRGFFDEEGRLVETQAVGRDITERKQLENESLQALEAAKTASSTMRRLVRTIAHEFRTPLGLLTGSTDILDRYWDRLTPKKRLEQNELIQNAAYQISSLVNSVISFQLSGTDKHANPPLVQDLEDICRSIASEVETVWSAGHEFIVSIAADCGSALLDGILFRQILQNLLTNAFRYTLSNGTVSLDVSREKNMLMLGITDTGIGIPEEEQALIFDAFYRSRNVEGRRGLGLGLSIVRDALAQMGGNITVTSSIGCGTTMRVGIPVGDPI